MPNLSRRHFLQQVCASTLAASVGYRLLNPVAAHAAQRPHIVFILVDDMGWGDPRCYNADSAIPTPNIDRLAREGRRFTDAHTPGAVCTPSRYGLLTGRYYWRLGLDRGGLDANSACIVEPERVTLPSMLRDRGYRTACIGKWHLGMGTQEPVDYTQRLVPNPTTAGFDYYFGIPASLDMAPYLYMENDHAVVPPSETIEGTPRGTAEFYRGGGIAPGFKHKDVLPTLTDKAVSIIDEHATGEAPLFLYFPMSAPHTPWLPVGDAVGKSEAGKYGDFVWQVDQSIGAVLDALARNDMAENTLLILASDNGGLQSWLPTEFDHRCNGPWRGQKADAWEGGHRVPFIVRWPGNVEAGSVSDATLCTVDMMATLAALTGEDLPAADPETSLTIAEDSVNLLPALLGGGPGRETLVVQSSAGLYTIRHDGWKLITGLGGGGLGWAAAKHQPDPGGPEGELYHLAEDPGETNNLWLEAPERREQLLTLLNEIQRPKGEPTS